jgi:phosphatidate cytidylyltransferase
MVSALVRSSNLALRVLTAVVFLPLIWAVMFHAPPIAWYGCVALALVLAAAELFGMTHPGDRVAQGIGVLSTLAVSVTLYGFGDNARALLTVLLAVPVIGMLIPLWRLGDISTAGLRQMAGVGGPLYIGALLTTVALLRRDLGSDGPEYVVLALTFAWLGDSGGYFAGRKFGRTKLYPQISPGKTRAGFLGAVVANLLAALVAHFWYLPSLPLAHAIGLAIVAGSLGQLGDLAESLLKRSSGIKDSGSILPGHGGILDRIDALMIVSPIVYLYAIWAAPAAG